ncbi:hypothetical protein, partial [Subtercola sp. RTI3]|uniref:hypothetical protein n=1 Tax=Subtercola sp. RTI3 TaxID=3048639 RepID=UPI002B23DBA6
IRDHHEQISRNRGVTRKCHLLVQQTPASDQDLLTFAQGQGVLAAGASKQASTDQAGAYEATTAKAKDLTAQLADLVDGINKANGVGQDASSANVAFQQSIADLDGQIKKAKDGVDGYKLSLDTTTQAGRDNTNMLDDFAAKGQAAATAQFNLDGNTQTYKATLEATRQGVIDRATALGANAEQAQAIADNIAEIPSETQWKVIADTAEAQRRIDAFNAAIATAKRDPVINVTMTTDQITNRITNDYGNGLGVLKASGGAITGPGTGTSDSIPARLSNGEHVLTARDVSAMGGQSAVYAMRASLYQNDGYANGGAVASNFRYAQPSYARSGSSPAPSVTHNHYYNFPEMGQYDPNTVVDIVARDFARRTAG